MDERVHLYVSRRNAFTWIMVLCFVYSFAARAWIFGFTKHAGTISLLGQYLLPLAATLLYLLIVLLDGSECYYRTSIPVCMMAVYGGICVAGKVEGKLYVWLFWIALIFLCLLYGEISSGSRQQWVWLLPFLVASVFGVVLYNNKNVFLEADWEGILRIHPDLILLFGWLLVSFAVRIHPLGQYHRRWGEIGRAHV